MNFDHNSMIRIRITLGILVTTAIVFGFGFVVVYHSSKNEQLIQHEHIGTIENCLIYRIKVKRSPPQLLWKCN